jgi:Carboxypeptidase regulatory-like domain
MKNSSIAVVVFVLFALAVAANAYPRRNIDAGRFLSGKVLDSHDRPLPDSVVYLTDMRTREVKSYIVAADGVYRFPALSPNVDYEIYAQYKGQKGDTKTLSQFDDRSQISINLRVDVR